MDRWVQDFAQYPDAIISPWTPRDLEEGGPSLTTEAREALLTCDVVYSAETFYDRGLVSMLTAAGIPTVRHINCELYASEGESTPWFPTSWRLPGVPDGPTVPVPVPDDRIVGAPAGEGKVLHVAGWKASHDRNGTQLLHHALLNSEREWRVTAQYGKAVRGDVEVVGEVADRWELYEGCSMLVLPRRYGGLCLPAQEAAARGMAIVMTDTDPNNEWPIVPINVTRTFEVGKRRKGRTKILHYADPAHILEQVDSLTGERLHDAQEAALAWARGLAWSHKADEYRMMFSQAIKDLRRG